MHEKIFLIASTIVLIVKATYHDDKCAKVGQYIQDEKIKIEEEKDLLPKAPAFLNSLEHNRSKNAVVESYGDIQRIFESVAERLKITELSQRQRDVQEEKLRKCQPYQDLVSECKSLVVKPRDKCDKKYPYRTLDGTCNNLKNPLWGSLFARHRRILPPSYKGLKNYRQSRRGGDLPQPRNLTLNLLYGKEIPSKHVSQLFMFFGQIVAHDTSDTAQPVINRARPPCCPHTRFCDPVKLSPRDPYYSQYNTSCGRFYRNVPYPTCSFSKREHFNNVPVFIDAHFTYGRDTGETDSLRLYKDSGKLNFQNTSFGGLMLMNKTEDDEFCQKALEMCFLGGDSRVNQHTTLLVLQTMFLREHNRLADALHSVNPHWHGEKIFQEARKILGAKLQCMIYKDFLPLYLGEDVVDEHDLRVDGGEDSYYDADVDPTVSSEFSAFGFRLHNVVGRIQPFGCANVNFTDLEVNTEPLYEGCIGDYLAGASQTPEKKFDRIVLKDLVDLVRFGRNGGSAALDMASVDVKRGRDRGIAPYVDYVKLWSKEKIVISKFKHFEKVMSKENAKLLASMYKHTGDVDVWVGMLMEDIVPGSMAGPTSLTLVVDHFMRQKSGDRFYFENQGMPNSFTEDQIESIRDVTLSQMICHNLDVDKMPVNAFLLPGEKNALQDCGDFEEFDISPWKDDA